MKLLSHPLRAFAASASSLVAPFRLPQFLAGSGRWIPWLKYEKRTPQLSGPEQSPLQRSAASEFSDRYPRAVVAFCAVVAAVIASYPVVFFGKSFVSPNNGAVLLYDHIPTVPGYTDFRPEDGRGADAAAMMWQHLPYTVMQHNALSKGELPLWNRFNSTGTPLFGQGQSMFGDPLHFLVIAAGGASWAFDLKFVLMKALFACGLGWCVLALTRDLAASMLLAFAAAFIGFFNFRLNHPAIFSVSYAPWILVAWIYMIQARENRSFLHALVLWFVANWMEITSGTVKEAYMLCASLNATGVISFLLTPHECGSKIRRGTVIGLAGFAFILASAPVWWTFLDTLSSTRSTYDVPHADRLPRAWLAGLFDDIFYRELFPGHNFSLPSTNLLVLLGCLWTILRPRELVRRPMILALLGSAVAAIALAFDWIPSSWIVQIPFLRNVYHVHNTFSCVAVVYLCVLAGWGFSVARQPLANGQIGRYGLAMAAVFGLLLFAYFRRDFSVWTEGQGWHGWRRLFPQHALFYLHVLLMVLSVALFMYLVARRLRGKSLNAAAVIVAAIAVSVLLVRHGQHLPFNDTGNYFAKPGPRVDLFTKSPSVQFLQGEVAAEPGRILGTGNNFITGFTAVYGFEGINGPDGLMIRYHRELAELAGLAVPTDWRFVMPPGEQPNWRPALDFLNVRYIANPPHPQQEFAHYHRVASLDFDIYKSETAWPRAFYTNHLGHYDSPMAFAQMLKDAPPGRPFASVQAGDTEAPVLPQNRPDETVVLPAQDYRFQTNATTFTINASAPGYVILHETWLPGDFRATLNGRSVPYFRVNHIFKGIRVPEAGVYRVKFSYWPRHFTQSLILSVFGIVLLVLVLVFVKRQPALRLPDGNKSQPQSFVRESYGYTSK